MHQLHGNLTPGRISVGCSHCLRRLTPDLTLYARTVTKQEYHDPHCLSWPRREPPSVYSRLFAAPCGGIQAGKYCVGFRCFLPHLMAQPLTWLMLIAITMGTCLMNGYAVFKEQEGGSQHRKTSHSICR